MSPDPRSANYGSHPSHSLVLVSTITPKPLFTQKQHPAPFQQIFMVFAAGSSCVSFIEDKSVNQDLSSTR